MAAAHPEAAIGGLALLASIMPTAALAQDEPSPPQETVEITVEPERPSVEVDDPAGQTLTQDFLERLPTGRSYVSAVVVNRIGLARDAGEEIQGLAFHLPNCGQPEADGLTVKLRPVGAGPTLMSETNRTGVVFFLDLAPGGYHASVPKRHCDLVDLTVTATDGLTGHTFLPR